MIIVSTLITAIAQILSMVIELYIWVVIIAAIISWVRPDPYSPIVQILQRLTEPVYDMVRKYIPTVFGGMDITPIIVILALQFFKLFFIQLLLELA